VHQRHYSVVNKQPAKIMNISTGLLGAIFWLLSREI